MVEVHFTINRNKMGWYITEIIGGTPRQTHGPFEGPINQLEAMQYIVANNQLTQ